jgi:hypothetical protein
MSERPRVSLATLLSRWAVGMGLVTWRYLWSTTPLHRTQDEQPTPQQPPELPADLRQQDLQPWESGVGPLYRRRFRVEITDSRKDAADVMEIVTADLERLMPREVVRVRRGETAGRQLCAGDDIVVDMPGPWNGPVRVVAAEPTRLHLATLAGHLEAGQIEFRAHDGDRLVFEIETWARSANRKVRLLYSHLRLAKEIQLNMWVRFCRAVARESGGRLAKGVEIRTTVSPAPGT